MKEQELFYENKIRTRTCGLLINEDKILLVKHLLRGKPFYSPPGGGVEFGETMNSALTREIKEETGLKVATSKFLFVTEYIQPPLHAIEAFYHIEKWSGTMIKGIDPEDDSVIKSVNWFSMTGIKKLKKEEVHHIFQYCNNLRDILQLSGHIPYTTF